MDQNKLVIRNVIRILGVIAGFAATIAAFIFRAVEKNFDIFTTACVASRICAIILFVFAIAFMVFDIVTKAYPISISAIGFVIALVAFVGSFIVAPASSMDSLLLYVIEHAKSLNEVDTTQLE
ncbi:MAG: hypothetical protein K2J80_03495, partial [Oscillospiraceae bacterium]|nr:hypothetical protein [Oscillospiraceae bacterium]